MIRRICPSCSLTGRTRPLGASAVTNRLGSNGNLNLNTSLDVDDDLLDDLSGGVQVNQTLVDPAMQPLSALHSTCFPNPQLDLPHLVHVPSLRTLTTRRLAGRDLEVLGRHADRALDAQFLALGALDQLAADFLERRDLAASEGDADLVDLGRLELRGLLGVLERHYCGWFARGWLGRSW